MVDSNFVGINESFKLRVGDECVCIVRLMCLNSNRVGALNPISALVMIEID